MINKKLGGILYCKKVPQNMPSLAITFLMIFWKIIKTGSIKKKLLPTDVWKFMIYANIDSATFLDASTPSIMTFSIRTLSIALYQRDTQYDDTQRLCLVSFCINVIYVQLSPLRRMPLCRMTLCWASWLPFLIVLVWSLSSCITLKFAKNVDTNLKLKQIEKVGIQGPTLYNFLRP
jgi:hypothetical protein